MIECEQDQETRFLDWAKSLRSFNWVASVQQDGPIARVVVRDMAIARTALLAEAAAARLALRRFEIVTPSLEDIFLQLVSEERKPE